MKNQFLILISIFLLLATSCEKELFEMESPTAGPADVVINQNHPMKDSLEAIIAEYVNLGIPGVQVAVKNADGWYITNGGYARVEDQSPLSPGQVSWYFSLTKMYTASLVMKQKESDQLRLDAPIAAYLPKAIAEGISGSKQVTVRMLLNHTSGIVNHTESPAFQLLQLNNPLKQPSAQECVEMIYGKPLMFEPGTDFFYSNTNYLLLSFILENISGKSYAQLLQEEILAPLNLQQTYYGLSEARIASLPFPNYYFDRFANEQLENISAWNAKLANNSGAYGGIAGTAADAIRFLEAWVEGRVVRETSRQEMREWVQGKESEHPDYGLGLEYFKWGNNSEFQYGHEGDGIGSTTQLMYVPANDTYLYINCLVGRQLYGPYLFKATDMKIALCKYVSRHQ